MKEHVKNKKEKYSFQGPLSLVDRARVVVRKGKGLPDMMKEFRDGAQGTLAYPPAPRGRRRAAR